jgi:hypothetical protein
LPQKNDIAAFKERFSMRPLLISALAATLIGCTCFAPQQAQQTSLTECAEANGFACSDVAAGTPQMDSKPLVLHSNSKTEKATAAKANTRHRKAKTHTKNAKSNIVPKMDASSSVQPDDKSNTVIDAKSTIAAKTEAPQSSQVDDKSDPVMKKAKATITAMMVNPASVEFVEMKRTDRKNTLGKSIDTICGYVRGKNASGGETGDRPFLYLVKEDRAYIGGSIMATFAYRNICN